MSAAADRKEELEALLWRNGVPAPLVAEILKAAVAYAKAARRAPGKAAEPKPPAVHHAVAGRGNPACRPFDWHAAANWAVSGDLKAVTCGHCRRIFGRPKAGVAS